MPETEKDSVAIVVSKDNIEHNKGIPENEEHQIDGGGHLGPQDGY